tara:strand:+ start:152 stop:676 length:525 start_codon:yes stop_codon:yes gene_type:complete
MPVKTNSQLAAFFNTGDQPSEAEFGHLIDTIQPPHVTLGDESKTLTVADHAYRLLIMPNISGARTLTLPTPILDTWFHIVSLPLATDGNTLTIKGTDESHFLHGSVVNYELDIDDNTTEGRPGATVVHGDGAADDVFTLPTGAFMDLWLHAKSSNVWYIWGHTASSATSTLTDA